MNSEPFVADAAGTTADASLAYGVQHVAARRISASGILFAAYLFSLPAYCLIRLSGQTDLIWPATTITLILWFACALAHALEHARAPRTLLMLGSGFSIALFFEYLGSSTGFLFGEYDYTELLGPKAFGQVPVLIPAAWFMMLYPAWEVARVLSQRLARPRSELGRHWAGVLRIVLASCAMTAWDLSLDPRMVADGAWIWPHGGAYFGIPLSNFAGWLVTSAVIFTTWTWIDDRHSPSKRQASASRRNLTSIEQLPLLIYVVTWLGESMANAVFWSGPLVGAIVFCAMGLFGAPVLWQMLRKPSR